MCIRDRPVTWLLVTSIVSKVESSVVFLIVIFPVSTSTISLKFRTIFAFTATLVALSAGVDEFKVGNTFVTLVKLNAVVELIPAYDPLSVSSNAVASINT